MHIMDIYPGERRKFGETALAIGYTLLVWGLVDRPLMMIVAAGFLCGGYAAIGQSVPHTNGERE